MQAESGLCVCTGRGLLLECSLVFYRPFCPVLARENSCLLQEGIEACTLQSLGESKRHLEIDQKVI